VPAYLSPHLSFSSISSHTYLANMSSSGDESAVGGVVPNIEQHTERVLNSKGLRTSLLWTTPPISARAANHQVFGFTEASADVLMIRLCLSTGVTGTAPAKHLRSLKPVSVYGGGRGMGCSRGYRLSYLASIYSMHTCLLRATVESRDTPHRRRS